MAQSTVRLIVDAQNAIRPLQRTNQLTEQLSKNTDKLKGRLDKSNRSLRDTGRSARTASTGINTLVASLRPLLAALALVGSARFIFVQTAELQTQRTALKQLTGSVEDANRIIKELQAFGNVTPFTSSELIEQAKRLKAFGFETETLVDMVKRLSDVAGATGADLSGISTAFGQILAKGKLQREEELQLLERGVDITSELKRITGLQGQEFETAMRKGQIGAELVLQALKNLTNEGGVFFGGATAQSQTLNGQVSTLVDNVQTLARTIGGALTPALMGALEAANKVLGAINRLLTSEFQRQISALRRNLILIPSVTIIKDLQNIKDFVERIQPLGLDVSAIDHRISQLEGTRKNIQNLMRDMVKRLSDEEHDLGIETLRAITAKINELEARKELISGLSFDSDLDSINVLLDEINLGTEDLRSNFEKVGDSIATGVSDALVSAIMQTKTLGEAARSILQGIATDLLRLGINTLLKSTGFGLFKNLPGFADGGRPPVGKPSVVGERGPELFVPSVAGTIIPNDKLGGSSTSVVVNVDASGSSVEGDEASAEELGRLIGAVVQSELIKEKRPGGLLA